MTIGGCRKNERCGELAGRIGKQQQTQQQTAVRATDVCATHFPPNITANNCCLVVSLAIGTFTKFFSHFNFDALEKLKAKSESTNWPFVCACVSAGYLPSYFVCSFARSFVWLVDRSVAFFLISISCKSVYFSVRRSSPDVPRKNHHTRARTHPHKYKNGPICWATLPGKCFFVVYFLGFDGAVSCFKTNRSVLPADFAHRPLNNIGSRENHPNNTDSRIARYSKEIGFLKSVNIC